MHPVALLGEGRFSLTAALRASAFVVVLMPAGSALAGNGMPLQLSPDATAADHRAPADTNVFDQFTRWLSRSVNGRSSDAAASRTNLGASARQNGGDTGGPALGTMSVIPTVRVLSQRRRCVLAPNGAPDCRKTAMLICRGKGFASGKTLEVQTEQKCPVEVLLGRRDRKSECRSESFVVRAICE